MNCPILYVAAASHDWYSGDIIDIGQGWNRTSALKNLFSKLKISSGVDPAHSSNIDAMIEFLQTHDRWNSGCITGKDTVGDGYDHEGLHIVVREIHLQLGFGAPQNSKQNDPNQLKLEKFFVKE